MNLKTLILLASIVAPSAVFAQRASTQPSGRGSMNRGDMNRGDMNRAEREMNRMRRDGPGLKEGARYTPQELEDLVAMMKEKLPNNYALYSRMPQQMPFRNNVFIPRMMNRYRQL